MPRTVEAREKPKALAASRSYAAGLRGQTERALRGPSTPERQHCYFAWGCRATNRWKEPCLERDGRHTNPDELAKNLQRFHESPRQAVMCPAMHVRLDMLRFRRRWALRAVPHCAIAQRM